MKYIFVFLLILLVTSVVWGQTETFADYRQSSLSPSESRYNSILFDMRVKQQRQLYSNPVYYEVWNKQLNLSGERVYRSVILTGYANGDSDGDFLLYEGNASHDFRLMAAGSYSLESAGTLFGSAQYARGTHKNVGWSAVRYAELYRPYFSTDSVGGDFEYEDYQVSGGYAFRLNDLFLGVYGAFHGEQAHRKTDPRALNNTTWLDLGMGVGTLFNDHLVMFRAGFGRNKQSLDLRYWRPGQQDRFFVGYGFGLYDTRLSAIRGSYLRMHYVKQGNTQFIYQSPIYKPLVVYGRVGYEYNYMNTEESSIKDLYHSKTHHIHPTIRIDWKTERSLSFSILLENLTDARKGYENIFEQYLADEANHIYDFRLIDTQQKYTYTQSESQVQIKMAYQLNNRHTMEFLGGISSFIREEKYKGENYKIKNSALFPHGGVGYTVRRKKSELSLSGLFIKKLLSGTNTYDVTMKSLSIEHLDFQHAFSPYAYYNSTYSCIHISGTYLYHLEKYGIGINLKWMYKQGDRNKDAIYAGQIGFESSAPLINQAPDKHDETWFSSSLLFVF